VAKNYLNEQELDNLNRIVSLYLDFAELQAKNKRAMYMKDWIAKLDDFLRLSEHDILTHAGKISHEHATQHAQEEYDRYKQQQLKEKTAVEKDFEKSLKYLENVEKLSKKNRDKKT
ncbi:MAG: virulence RhuM family protein, partial [Acetobacter sp.]|nr:virulence RhuM family protein [Acetobacter sp.]